ncbi:nucleoside diphosphate kinase regulator [Verrucomicrobiaceae bacterium 5K15]|uniref:Nucleoside diphosphate kinase regulator n=1 Tax=Oceaniferula flava TaxID=2800421 RepID=A0AAE2S9Z2_9BACT|nr:nucleoside diphosphate kinase regulator [Oceaniferula flavus]MBK1854150.1 nucleoside diphosphate kinase regulator [Oceaniferula flavus]MBM1135456.1 nucleoside diphosphate kinase regulator [Oceaniferula flavus]
MKTSTSSAVQSLPIHITSEDKARLEGMIAKMQRSGEQRDGLSTLIHELDRASVISEGEVSRDLVTMNSEVSIINQDTAEKLQFTLVYPEDADVDAGKISVLSPIGCGMLGYKVGDEFEWQVPAGVRRFVVAKVDFQPGKRS